jgi:hypothetical protein
MILYLRNKNNRTIVDIEIFVKRDEKQKFVELRSVVVIDTYSEFLLNNLDKSDEVIDVFSRISKLRGFMWEDYFMDRDNTPDELKNVVRMVGDFLKDVATKYGLYYVTD